nr:MAG TPA: Superinfection immunity protein [Caudoviricetes sp.]
MTNKKEVLVYIRKNPGCMATAVANGVFGKWRWSGWIFAREEAA